MQSNRTLLMGNEAIARGALEGGVAYCTGYPGNPSSEIIETLISYQQQYDLKAEWSVNEIVALEAAAAFAFSGMRAIVTMKQNGMNALRWYTIPAKNPDRHTLHCPWPDCYGLIQ